MKTAQKKHRRRKVKNTAFYKGVSLSEAAKITNRSRFELWVLAKRRCLFTIVNQPGQGGDSRRKIYLLPGEVDAFREGGIESLIRYQEANKAQENESHQHRQSR